MTRPDSLTGFLLYSVGRAALGRASELAPNPVILYDWLVPVVPSVNHGTVTRGYVCVKLPC